MLKMCVQRILTNFDAMNEVSEYFLHSRWRNCAKFCSDHPFSTDTYQYQISDLLSGMIFEKIFLEALRNNICSKMITPCSRVNTLYPF